MRRQKKNTKQAEIFLIFTLKIRFLP